MAQFSLKSIGSTDLAAGDGDVQAAEDAAGAGDLLSAAAGLGQAATGEGRAMMGADDGTDTAAAGADAGRINASVVGWKNRPVDTPCTTSACWSDAGQALHFLISLFLILTSSPGINVPELVHEPPGSLSMSHARRSLPPWYFGPGFTSPPESNIWTAPNFLSLKWVLSTVRLRWTARASRAALRSSSLRWRARLWRLT